MTPVCRRDPDETDPEAMQRHLWIVHNRKIPLDSELLADVWSELHPPTLGLEDRTVDVIDARLLGQ